MNNDIRVCEIRAVGEIENYHAHIYFDGDKSRDAAEKLCNEISCRFPVQMLGTVNQSIGMHTKPMMVVAFTPDQFQLLVPWLMLNRATLSILVHPNTDDAQSDHQEYALWLGEPVVFAPIDEIAIEFRPTRSLSAAGLSHPPVVVNTKPKYD